MKIVRIFANTLFAFHYDGESDNEFDRNIELWTNPFELLEFAKTYVTCSNYAKYVQERIEDAEQIIDLVEELSQNDSLCLEQFFQPLSDKEGFVKTLPFQKGKTKQPYRRNDLRLYAIKIDENCFVITGGAIKVSQTMQENVLTNRELDKLKTCKQYLEGNGVFDKDSFFELVV